MFLSLLFSWTKIEEKIRSHCFVDGISKNTTTLYVESVEREAKSWDVSKSQIECIIS